MALAALARSVELPAVEQRLCSAAELGATVWVRLAAGGGEGPTSSDAAGQRAVALLPLLGVKRPQAPQW